MIEYTASPPRDEYKSTLVTFTTEGGPFRVSFKDATHFFVTFGDHNSEPLTLTSRGVAFLVTSGSGNFYASTDWDDIAPDEGTTYHTMRLDYLTPKRRAVVKAEIRTMVLDYMRRYPLVPAHAEARARQFEYAEATREARAAELALGEADGLARAAKQAATSARNAELRETVTTAIEPYYDDKAYRPVAYISHVVR